MLADDVRDCHVLVNGSSGVSVRTTVEDSRYRGTVLVPETLVGNGGCTMMADGLPVRFLNVRCQELLLSLLILRQKVLLLLSLWRRVYIEPVQ